MAFWDSPIENKVHWVRDVVFDEDRSPIRTGNGPRAMATLRNLAASVYSQIEMALGHFWYRTSVLALAILGNGCHLSDPAVTQGM